jgi:hypothetical protein
LVSIASARNTGKIAFACVAVAFDDTQKNLHAIGTVLALRCHAELSAGPRGQADGGSFAKAQGKPGSGVQTSHACLAVLNS